MAIPSNKWPRADGSCVTALAERRASAAPHRPPLSHTVGPMVLLAWYNRVVHSVRGWVMNSRARTLLLVLPLAILLCVSCASDRRACLEPEPGQQELAYIFRGMVSLGPGSGEVVRVYWYFECGGWGCRYVGHWNPIEEPESPAWFATVLDAEACYDDPSWGCGDTLGIQCSDPSYTPRENQEAEEASIWLSGGLVAPPELYDRIAQDLRFIRTSFGDTIPELRDIRFTPYMHSNVIGLELMPEAVSRFREGKFHDLDSLNAHFKVTEVRVDNSSSCGPWFTLFFDGRYDTIQLSKIYKDTPSVLWAEAVGGWGGWWGPITVIPWPIE